MQEMSKENVDLKYKIDLFKRDCQQKLSDLRGRLGLDIALESVLKSKGNARELQTVKEHKEAIERTETYNKLNREIERKLEGIDKAMEDD